MIMYRLEAVIKHYHPALVTTYNSSVENDNISLSFF